MKTSLIVVADQSRARIFKTETASAPLIEIGALTHSEARLHDRELTSDLPGRIKGSGHIGHAFEQATDPKQHLSVRFGEQCVIPADAYVYTRMELGSALADNDTASGN